MIEFLAFLIYLLVWSVPITPYQYVPVKEPEPEPPYRIVYMDVTAYTPYESEMMTASGNVPVEGVTVAYNDVPLGTQIEIDGHIYTVQDRCGMDRVDIFMESYDEAMAWGVRTKEIKVYDN